MALGWNRRRKGSSYGGVILGVGTKTQVIFHLLGPIDFTICFDLMTWQVVAEELDGESLFGSGFWGWVCLILFVFLNFKPTTNRRNWVECLDGWFWEVESRRSLWFFVNFSIFSFLIKFSSARGRTYGRVWNDEQALFILIFYFF